LLGVISYFLIRIRNYRKKYQLRNKLARDLHDELSNSFYNIRIIAKEVDFENIGKAKNDINLIKNMSGEAIGKVEDVIWSLDRENYTVGHVIMKLEDFLDDVLRAKNIPVSFVKENINEDGKLNYLYRRNLLLIFKEAITNAVRHTNPTQVDILFKDQNDSIYFSIENNFNEFVKAKYSTGLGISGMKQRAKFINATLEIEKSDNKFKVIMIMKKMKLKFLKKK